MHELRSLLYKYTKIGNKIATFDCFSQNKLEICRKMTNFARVFTIISGCERNINNRTVRNGRCPYHQD